MFSEYSICDKQALIKLLKAKGCTKNEVNTFIVKSMISSESTPVEEKISASQFMDENFQSLVYDKTEVDALIPDISNFETSNQLDLRLANYTTLSLFEAHEELIEQELNDKQDTPATGEQFALVSQLPDTSSFITLADLPNTSSFITSNDLPDTSSFITDQVSSLANYDTSSTVDNKIASAGVGSFWTKNSANQLTYTTANVGVGIDTADEKLHVNGNIRLGGNSGADENASYYI